MPSEDNRSPGYGFFEEIGTHWNLPADDKAGAEGEQEALAKKIFGLALALITEPSKLVQLRQILVQLQQQRGLPEDFSCWAIRHIDASVMAMALEYAHDAEVLVQMLSFKGGTLASLMQAVEDLHQHEQITERVYVKAKLVLWTPEPPQQEQQVS